MFNFKTQFFLEPPICLDLMVVKSRMFARTRMIDLEYLQTILASMPSRVVSEVILSNLSLVRVEKQIHFSKTRDCNFILTIFDD
jgi:hypothetical protein